MFYSEIARFSMLSLLTLWCTCRVSTSHSAGTSKKYQFTLRNIIFFWSLCVFGLEPSLFDLMIVPSGIPALLVRFPGGEISRQEIEILLLLLLLFHYVRSILQRFNMEYEDWERAGFPSWLRPCFCTPKRQTKSMLSLASLKILTSVLEAGQRNGCLWTVSWQFMYHKC